jgi:hypothetical protein
MAESKHISKGMRSVPERLAALAAAEASWIEIDLALEQEMRA